jgi:hypothetical protein
MGTRAHPCPKMPCLPLGDPRTTRTVLTVPIGSWYAHKPTTDFPPSLRPSAQCETPRVAGQHHLALRLVDAALACVQRTNGTRGHKLNVSVDVYKGQGVSVQFNAARCIHAAECAHGLPAVFDP